MLVERTIPEGLDYRRNRKRRSVRPSARRSGETRSLDSFNHLATSENNERGETFAVWLKRNSDARDQRRRLCFIHTQLLESLKGAALVERYLHQESAIEGATRGTSAWQKAAQEGGRRRWSAWKDFERVAKCQTEFIGFRPTCCGGRSVAVPIGCNHRLCPLCSAHRAEHYRERIRALFASGIQNPQLLTLTVPNVGRLSRRTIPTLRRGLKAFLKENKALLMGGVYSIEITRNREAKTWHPHIHALVDVNDTRRFLPERQFLERKWRLEFSWFCITQGPKIAGKRHWRASDYEEWVSGVDPVKRGENYIRLGQRRTVHLKPCTADKKAAYEVLKYITKAAHFVDDPRAVAEFLRAVKGVRVIQTFGSCYGFKLEEKPVETILVCECGENKFERVGVLGLGMTKMSPEGKWYIRDDAPLHGRQRCRGKTSHSPGGTAWQ
jgi:hypothetical protein